MRIVVDVPGTFVHDGATCPACHRSLAEHGCRVEIRHRDLAARVEHEDGLTRAALYGPLGER